MGKLTSKGGFEVKFDNRTGVVTEIRNPRSNKIEKCVKVGSQKHGRNSTFKTYPSTKDGNLLHKSNAKKIRKC